MQSFIDYLLEKQLNIGNKSSYPRFNNILILAGGAGCFAGDTLVKTDKGYKPIQEVEDGDVVETLNEATGEHEWKVVEDIHMFQPTKQMVRLTLESGETIICSEDHEFYVDGKWVEAKDLSIQKEFIEYNEPLYDLSVEGNHNYVVTKSDIVVHNSGKGFAYSNIIGFEGKKFDVDEIKSNMLKYKPKQLSDMFLKQTGRELSSIDLKNSTDVSVLHQFVSNNKIDDKFIENFLAAQAKLKNKPNIIFDVTLKNTKKLQEISDYVTAVGYDKSNIHVVWIMNKFEVAYEQNKQRARSVSDEIMFTTHTGASLTMKELVANSNKWSKVANGDYWILFNQAKVDNELVQTDKDEEGKFSKDGTIYKDRVINPDGTLGKEITHRRKNFIVKRYDAIKIKSRNKVANMAEIESTVIDKINSYAPIKGKQW